MSAIPDAVVAALYARVVAQLTQSTAVGRAAAGATGGGGAGGAVGPGPLEPPPAPVFLSTTDAAALWSALLAERFVTAQEAALLMALRLRGDCGQVLAAFAQASRGSCVQVRPPDPGVTVVVHAQGTARHHPVLAPLLARRVAALGVPTLLVTHDAGRGPNATAVLHALRVRRCQDEEDAGRDLASHRFAWLPLEAMSEDLGRLAARERVLGFRTPALRVARLVAPVDGRCLLVSDCGDDPADALADAVEQLRACALLVRGPEGDPVDEEGGAGALRCWIDGVPAPMPVTEDARAPRFPMVGHVLPQVDDVPATARFSLEAVRGAIRLPPGLDRQAQAIVALVQLMKAGVPAPPTLGPPGSPPPPSRPGSPRAVAEIEPAAPTRRALRTSTVRR